MAYVYDDDYGSFADYAIQLIKLFMRVVDDQDN